ncbi:uncharacterized protein LOC119775001 [Cyprinodon tularosa]|uniref:uncharacterized protein LOC119775001 n=1 Tax=Cyprinodon tularosa TaxID=77115 RepID=UPI0018E285A2|nr:uncharacterized protein LOC119775001 [Cyprinodon tularosa]
MTRASVTKILLLVIIALIVCLPEFFRIYSVSEVNFLCLSYQPSEQMYEVWRGGNRSPGNLKASMPKNKQWEQICIQESQRNPMDLNAETQEVPGDSRRGWFMCETDKNMDVFYNNISSALIVLLEVSVSFQLNDTETINVTLYGQSNQSDLYLNPPEEGKDQMDNGAAQGEAFYCCLPFIATSNSANRSRCLLWLANQTVLTRNETEALPWKRADKGVWCRYRVTWMVLMCVVFLIVVIALIQKIYVGKRSHKKPLVDPIVNHYTNQQLKGKAYRVKRLQSFSGLSPIPEIESQESPSSLLPSSQLLPHRRTSVPMDVQQKQHRNGLTTL